MATTTMASLGFYDILVRQGAHGPVTVTLNGADIFPGMPLTAEGETHPNVTLPDGLGDSVFAVAALLENQDIGTVYSTTTEIPAYTTGSGAIVRMYHAPNGGSIVRGDILVSQTVEAVGFVEPLAKALNDFIADGSAGTILATQIKHVFSLVGRAQETHASTGITQPIRVLLSI